MAKSKQTEPAAYISLWENEYATTDAHPMYKGTLQFTIDEMKEILNEAVNLQGDGDDQERYILDVAIWEKPEGGGKYPVLTGVVKVRQPKKEEPAKKQRRTTRR